jgi:ribosomal protein S18 acetylase RimI-like enzyme
MINITQASGADIPIIQKIASETWWPTYTPLLSKEQIDFMLRTLYSTETLQKVMENGSQAFLLLFDEHGPQGFASYGLRSEDPAVYKLHKLYVLPENHGKGYGRMLIEDVQQRAIANNIYTLDLNVKKDNPARSFYEKLGFRIIREEDIPFGPYLLSDFVMRLEIEKH